MIARASSGARAVSGKAATVLRTDPSGSTNDGRSQPSRRRSRSSAPGHASASVFGGTRTSRRPSPASRSANSLTEPPPAIGRRRRRQPYGVGKDDADRTSKIDRQEPVRRNASAIARGDLHGPLCRMTARVHKVAAALNPEPDARPHCQAIPSSHRPPRRRPACCFVACLTVARPLPDRAPRARDDQARPSAHFTLANGLEVVVMPDRRTPVVTHMVWYKVGSADETPGKSGLAHFLEHLMFKGTAKNPAGKFSQGGRHHRRPGERVHLAATTPATSSGCRARTCKTMMEFEADRMTGLVLTDESVMPELKVVLEEQNQRVANNPRRAARRADRRRALSQPSLRPAGDRLAARDRGAHPRRRDRVLQALLHAQQRRPRGRRRRHRPTR